MRSREDHASLRTPAFGFRREFGPANAARPRPTRRIGTWRGTGKLVVGGASAGRVHYSIEVREDWLGVKSGSGILTGDDRVIARAFGRPEVDLMIESGDTIRVAVTEVRGTLQRDKAVLPSWQYLRSWR